MLPVLLRRRKRATPAVVCPLPLAMAARLSFDADVTAIAALWPAFLEVCEAVSAPDAEPLVEDWAVFVSLFNRLDAAGCPFDETFRDAVLRVEVGLFLSDEGSPSCPSRSSRSK